MTAQRRFTPEGRIDSVLEFVQERLPVSAIFLVVAHPDDRQQAVLVHRTYDTRRTADGAVDRVLPNVRALGAAHEAAAAVREWSPLPRRRGPFHAGHFVVPAEFAAATALVLTDPRGHDVGSLHFVVDDPSFSCESLGDLPQTVTALLSEAAVNLRRRVQAGLTPREIEVMRHVAAGSTNTDIAEALAIAPRTVATHVEAVLRKIDSPNRAQASAWVVVMGLADPPPLQAESSHGSRAKATG